MKSVMIIEDEFIVAEDLKAAVELAGYSVFGIAHNYAKAIEMLKHNRPDLALVDITLDQDRSGILLGLLFNGPLKVPYAYVTAHADPGTLRRAEVTFPKAYIMKPFKREQIARVLHQLDGRVVAAEQAKPEQAPVKKEKKSLPGVLRGVIASFL